MLSRAVCCFLLLALAGLPAIAEPPAAQLAVDDGTAGLWRFREGTGERVAGEGGAPAGTLQGAVWVPGRFGYAAATHAGHVSIPDDSRLRPSAALTVEAWAKLAHPEGDLVCKNIAYMIRLGGGMKGYLHIDGQWRIVSGRRPVPSRRWTHLAMTYDSATRTAALYVDGALDVRQEIPGLATGLLGQGTEELRVGANTWNPQGSRVDGKVDAVRISNVVRTFEPLPHPPPPAAEMPGNLVPNGGFELGLMGWRADGEADTTLCWVPVTSGAASGRGCVRTTEAAGGSNLLSRPIPVLPGTRYTLSARFRSDAPGGRATVAASAFGLPGDTKPPASVGRSVDLAPEWRQVVVPVALPADWPAPSVCIRIQRPREGRLWVDDVRFFRGEREGEPSLHERIGVGAETGRPGNLYLAGQQARLDLRVVNGDARAHRVTVRAQTTDWEGRTRALLPVGTYDVPAGQSVPAWVPMGVGGRGSFRMAFILSTEGQEWQQTADLRYAVVTPLRGHGDAEGSAFGMNTHMEREPTPHLQRNLETLSQCGVKWIRGWWGWGMCEKERGQFDWAEYDRQLETVERAGMRLMPILLRYYPSYEQAWAGKTEQIQQPPYRMEEWGAFVRKVVERYRGRVSAWEIWNEPAYSGADLTAKVYAQILAASAPAIRETDPKARIIGFAGVQLPYMEETLAQGALPAMDVVSEHSYVELARPEAALPERTTVVRALLAGKGGEKPIWHSEQGVGADGEGYVALPYSEAEAAALYTRNLVVARSLGIEKYFWFSAQTSPTYGWAVFYEDYIPRPRLVALNACASLLEGTTFRKAYQPARGVYAYLFEGSKPAAVAWSIGAASQADLPVPAARLSYHDLMGNRFALQARGAGCRLKLPVDRPVYLRAGAGAELEKALAGMKVTPAAPIAVTVRMAAGGPHVTITNRSRTPLDGIVDLLPGSRQPRHFHSLAPDGPLPLDFRAAGLPAHGQVRVRCGDRDLAEVLVAY